MVGHVGGEVGGLAVGLEERPVAVVAEAGRLDHLQRGGDVFVVVQVHALGRRQHLHRGQALLVEDADGLAQPVLVVQRLLAEEAAESDPEQLQVLAHQVLEDEAGGEPPQRLADLLERPGRIAARLEPGARDVEDVLALVVLRIERNAWDVGTQLRGAREDRVGEPPHLAAGVVDVELAKHLVSRPFEEIGDDVADHRPAAVADVHGSGGIGADELHHRPQAAAGIAAAEAFALRPDGA